MRASRGCGLCGSGGSGSKSRSKSGSGNRSGNRSRSRSRRVSAIAAARCLRLVSFCVWVRCVVWVVRMRRRTGWTTFSFGTLELVKLIAGKHGQSGHLGGTRRTGSQVAAKFAIRVAVILLISYLPSKLSVVDMATRFGGSRCDSRSGRVIGRAASRLATGRLLVVCVNTALLWIGVNANVTCQFIAAAETLLASRVCADVGLLAGMCANVSCLMLETVEST